MRWTFARRLQLRDRRQRGLDVQHRPHLRHLRGGPGVPVAQAPVPRPAGLAAIERRNIDKAKLLYGAIDASSLYVNRVDPSCRSRMNVPFFLKDERLNDSFLRGQGRRFAATEGPQVVGGMRASIYNAMSMEGVQACGLPAGFRGSTWLTPRRNRRLAATGPARPDRRARPSAAGDLLNQRARGRRAGGEIKRAEGSPFFRPDRVAQVIRKIRAANPGPLGRTCPRPSGARSCRPAWRWSPQRVAVCWGLWAPSASKPRWSSSVAG